MNDSDRGAARAKGQTTAEVLREDRCAAPPPLLEERYAFLGDEDIPISRYISREFFEREIEALWPRTWQWACREEHLQEVGDTHVYDVGPYSVIVVRSGPDSIEAFLNSCTHRGTRILSAEGSGFSKNFTCPFHGWCWKLDGSIPEPYARYGATFLLEGEEAERGLDPLERANRMLPSSAEVELLLARLQTWIAAEQTNGQRRRAAMAHDQMPAPDLPDLAE